MVETLCDSRSISNWLDNSNKKRLGHGVVDFKKVDDLVAKLQEWDGNVYSEGFSDPKSKGVRDTLMSFRKAYVSARLNEVKDDEEIAQTYKKKLEKMNKEKKETDFAQCHTLLVNILDEADAVLEKEKYLAGDAYSEADALLSTIVWRVRQTGRWKEEFEVQPDGNTAKFKNVKKWFDERIRSRDSWKGAFEMYSYQKNPLFAILPLLPSLIWWYLTGRI